MADLAAAILALLPHTQCTRCGYADCAAYARAIADDVADINQCPPGGVQGIERLAAVTQRAQLGLNPACGAEAPRSVAYIDETWCIGCTLCIKACPVDAIVGANKLMHSVIEHYCTGCELCLAVCPVDCIKLADASQGATGWAAWSAQQADAARLRYTQSCDRRKHQTQQHATRLEVKATRKLVGSAGQSKPVDSAEKTRRSSVIEAALARARAQREGGARTAQVTAKFL